MAGVGAGPQDAQTTSFLSDPNSLGVYAKDMTPSSGQFLPGATPLPASPQPSFLDVDFGGGGGSQPNILDQLTGSQAYLLGRVSDSANQQNTLTNLGYGALQGKPLDTVGGGDVTKSAPVDSPKTPAPTVAQLPNGDYASLLSQIQNLAAQRSAVPAQPDVQQPNLAQTVAAGLAAILDPRHAAAIAQAPLDYQTQQRDLQYQRMLQQYQADQAARQQQLGVDERLLQQTGQRDEFNVDQTNRWNQGILDLQSRADLLKTRGQQQANPQASASGVQGSQWAQQLQDHYKISPEHAASMASLGSIDPPSQVKVGRAWSQVEALNRFAADRATTRGLAYAPDFDKLAQSMTGSFASGLRSISNQTQALTQSNQSLQNSLSGLAEDDPSRADIQARIDANNAQIDRLRDAWGSLQDESQQASKSLLQSLSPYLAHGGQAPQSLAEVPRFQAAMVSRVAPQVGLFGMQPKTLPELQLFMQARNALSAHRTPADVQRILQQGLLQERGFYHE
jgi:hypothetical protein